MTDQRLTETLAVHVMGWRAAPGRYLKSDRRWVPSWRFAPLTDLRDAFALLESAGAIYTVQLQPNGAFEAEVQIGSRIGRWRGVPSESGMFQTEMLTGARVYPSGDRLARVITYAVAKAAGIEISL